MNGLQRFLVLGCRDADARVARWLAPRAVDTVDQYVRTSATVRAADGVTQVLQQAWLSSAVGQTLSGGREMWRQELWRVRYRSIAIALLAAAAVHVLLTLANGARPGWFWLILPALAAALAVVLIVGSGTRSRH